MKDWVERIEEKPNSMYLRYYYGSILNRRECSDEDILTTSRTIDYLKDCGFNIIEILAELSRHTESAITGDILTDNLWKGSLVKKRAFYLHRELRLISPPPIYDFKTDTLITSKFYCEMKIRYTTNDVLQYFYNRIGKTNRQLVEERADRRAIDYMMKLYKNIDYVEPLDIILTSIDRYLAKNPDCHKLIETTDDNIEIIKELQRDMLQLEAQDLRQIIWR